LLLKERRKTCTKEHFAPTSRICEVRLHTS